MRLLVSCMVFGALAACQVEEPAVSATEQLSVITTPGISHVFPNTQVGLTSTPLTITVSPGPGPNYDTITSITGCPGFVINSFGLPTDVYRTCADECIYPTIEQCPIQPAAAICQTLDYDDHAFTVAFRPTVAADLSCVIKIYGGASLLRSYTVSGKGTPVPIDIDVQPSSVAFGQVRPGNASTAAMVTVRNLGGATLTVSSVSISAGFTIASGPTGSYGLVPNGTQTYAITCNPSAIGAMSGTLRVNSNDPTTPAVSVPLSCTGIDSALDVSPSPAQLPTTRVGEPVERVISLVNSGNASMTISSVTLTGTGLAMVTAPPAGTVLGAGQSTSARIAFDASASGDAAGALVVAYDSGQSRTVEVSARALATSMSLSPDGNVDLGPVCIDHTAEQTFTIVANDQGPFAVDQISSPAAPFSLNTIPLPAAVQGAGANSVTFTVIGAPTTPGLATSTLSVMTDIPGATPRDINLAVEGLTAGVSATPALVDFGSHMLDTTTLGEQVHISNCGSSAVTLANARIEGVDAADFTIVQAPPSLEVAPTGKASFLVVASVKGVGLRGATFVAEATSAEDPTPTAVSVALSVEGLGLGEGAGGGDGEGGPASYYACSTGTGSAAWPLGLALVALLRRRRRR